MKGITVWQLLIMLPTITLNIFLTSSFIEQSLVLLYSSVLYQIYTSTPHHVDGEGHCVEIYGYSERMRWYSVTLYSTWCPLFQAYSALSLGL